MMKATAQPWTILCFAGGVLIACAVEPINLGTDCPDLRGPCPAGDKAGGPPRDRAAEAGPNQPAADEDTGDGASQAPEAGPVLDGGPPDASSELADADDPPLDAAPEDAGEDAASAVPLVEFPKFSNPSFEPPSGVGGELTLTSPRIAPWTSCQPVGITEELTANLVESERVTAFGGIQITPSDGDFYVAMDFLTYPAPLYQQLEEPLRAGQTYAFAIDVRYTGLGDQPPTLNVYGSNTQCMTEELLMQRASLSQDWAEVCITITPQQDYTEIMLRPGTSKDLPFALGDTLYIDNIHQSETCR